MRKLLGLTTAMVTPFAQDGRLDLDALKRLTEFYIEQGVNGLYVCGTTGEFYSMTVEERMAAAEAVARQVAGRAAVYSHVGAVFAGETLKLARHARDTGCDGVGIMTPVFHDIGAAEIERYFIDIARQLPEDFPIYLYNIPQRTGNDLSARSVGRIAEACPNVVGIKYSYPDLQRTAEYLLAKPGFSVMQGCESLMLAELSMGCDGVVSGISSAFPDLYAPVYAAWQQHDTQRARAAQRTANRTGAAVCRFGSIRAFKGALRWRGVDAGFVRAPAMDLSPSETSELTSALDQLTSS